MAYDKILEKRIETLIAAWPDLEKKKMFGGVCYLLGGNIAFGIWQELLIVRTTPEQAGRLLQREHTRPFDITGRPMKGWLMVDPPAMATAAALEEWLATGRDFARTLPAK
ncbi:MAG: TfoX/Sxy family protein [Geobacter sp.]|nr:TfoX/Sxy family protein [Geobacter sp.]